MQAEGQLLIATGWSPLLQAGLKAHKLLLEMSNIPLCEACSTSPTNTISFSIFMVEQGLLHDVADQAFV